MSGDLQATLEFTVEFSKFHNVDLFQRGFYNIRCTLKPPAKIATSVDVEYKRGAEERRGDNCLFPAFVEPVGSSCSGITRTFQILYRNEDVTLSDAFVFTLHMLVDSTKVVKQIDTAEIQLLVELYFCDSELGVSSPEHLSNVCTQTLNLHMSCVRGIHHAVPLLFDYYHFAVVDTTVHGILTSVGLPDLSILRPLKGTWLGKGQSNVRISTSTFYISLYGNRAESNSKPKAPQLPNRQTRYPTEIHRIVCTTLLSVQVNLLAYFQSLLEFLPENQRIPVGSVDSEERLSSLSRGLEVLTDKDEIFSKICSDFSILSSEISLFWSQFQEFFILNKHIMPYLREEHHRQRVGHLSEAFFLQEYPLNQLTTLHQPNNFQAHQNLAQSVRNSKYYQSIPALSVECPLLDGDQLSTPIIFEERFTSWPSTASRKARDPGCDPVETFSSVVDAEGEMDSESGSSEDQQLILNDIMACHEAEANLGLHLHQNNVNHVNSEQVPGLRSDIRTVSRECRETPNEQSLIFSQETDQASKKEATSLEDVGIDILSESSAAVSSLKGLRESRKNENICPIEKLMKPLDNERTTDSLTNQECNQETDSSLKEECSSSRISWADSHGNFVSGQEYIQSYGGDETLCKGVRETDICDDILKETHDTTSIESSEQVLAIQMGKEGNESELKKSLANEEISIRDDVAIDNVAKSEVDGVAVGKDDVDDVVVKSDAGDDSAEGNMGVDVAKGDADDHVANGDAGDDVANGDADGHVARGGAGDDVANGDSGVDVAKGDAGVDVAKRDAGVDVAKGGIGEDVSKGNDDEDVAKGDAADDNVESDVVDDVKGVADDVNVVKGYINEDYVKSEVLEGNAFSDENCNSDGVPRSKHGTMASCDDEKDSTNQEVSEAVTAIAAAVTAAAEVVAEKAAEAVAAAAEAIAAASGPEIAAQTSGTRIFKSVVDSEHTVDEGNLATEKPLSKVISSDSEVVKTEHGAMTVENLSVAERTGNGDEISRTKPVFNIDVTTTNESNTSLVTSSNSTTQESSSSVYDTPLSSETSLSTYESWTDISISPAGTPSLNTASGCPNAGSSTAKTSKKVKKSSSGKSRSSLGSCFPITCVGNVSPTFSVARGNSVYGSTVRSKFDLAKATVKSTLAYPSHIYSELPSPSELEPYFSTQQSDSMETHLVVCVHGLDGNSGDLRLFRCYLEMALPSTRLDFLMSEVNQPDTFVSFEQMTDKLVSEIKHYIEAYTLFPTKISFIGHSLGNIIIRSALTHREMEPYLDKLHTLLSLSGPHLGMLYHTSSLVSTGLWFMQKWKKSDSLLQLSLHDMPDPRHTFIYRLSQSKGLEYFNNVLLVSSVQDHYVPFHSARIEGCKASMRDNSEYGVVYREMIDNLLRPLASKPSINVVRYSVFHAIPSSANSFIGRAAHIAMLDSDLFIEKLLLVSAQGFFR